MGRIDNINPSISYLEAESSSSQTVSDSTETSVIFSKTLYSRSQPHTNDNIAFYPKEGWSLITYQIVFSANATGTRAAWILKNGDTNSRYAFYETNADSATGGFQTIFASGYPLYFNGTTDYFQIKCYQTSTVSLTIGATPPSLNVNRLSIHYLHE